MSLELVVVAIVILIVALVVIGIFTGGMQNFMNIFGFQSDTQIKQSLCQTTCASYCFSHSQTTQEIKWSDTAADGSIQKPTYKGATIPCDQIYGGPCKCNKI
jgi:hypothetical protein